MEDLPKVKYQTEEYTSLHTIRGKHFYNAIKIHSYKNLFDVLGENFGKWIT